MGMHAVGVVSALVLLLALTTVRSSNAAFTATTVNAASTWSAGTVALADDDAGSAMFSVSGMLPGVASTRCISVSYGGSANAAVRLYGAITGGTGLGPYLNLTIERGTGGSFASCAGFTATETAYTGTLSAFAAAATGFGTGVGTWAPLGGVPGQNASYRFTVSVQDNNLAQGLSATATFTWEAQNL